MRDHLGHGVRRLPVDRLRIFEIEFLQMLGPFSCLFFVYNRRHLFFEVNALQYLAFEVMLSIKIRIRCD